MLPVPPDAAAQQEAAEQAAQQAAKAQAAAAKKAAEFAAAAQRDQASWSRHGKPSKMVIIKERTVDVIADGRLTRATPRSGGAVNMTTLARYVPDDWLSINGGTADLSAAIVLTPGQALTLGGDVQTVRLAGGPAVSDAASIYSGHGRLTLRGVTVASYDASTQQPMPAGPGRPYMIVAGGGRIDATDSAVNDLGTAPTDQVTRPGLALGENSTGSLVRVTFARNTIGLKLDRTTGVHLEALTLSDSADDGMVLRGDRGTELIGIKSDDNAGNGVTISSPSSDRPITGIEASGNKLFGLSLHGQSKPQLNGITTANNTVGGIQLGSSTDVAINDFTSSGDAIGIYSHVSSGQITVTRAQISGARRGMQIEKTTTGVTVNASTITGASITGISIGGHQVTLNQDAITDSATAVRVERGASDITAEGLSLSGGEDGVVALSGTTNVVLRNLVAEGVSRAAVRNFSSGLQVLNGHINGSSTGIDADAATTISGTTIDAADEGIRVRSTDLVDIGDADISALSVGINAAGGSPVKLTASHIDALEAIRGAVAQDGINDLSLPPLNLLGAIGVPLILLAMVLEQVAAFRQRGVERGGYRMPPPLPMVAT